jgi:hypothetical protein
MEFQFEVEDFYCLGSPIGEFLKVFECTFKAVFNVEVQHAQSGEADKTDNDNRS